MRVVWHQMGGSSITSADLAVPIPAITRSDDASRAQAVAVALGNYTIISSQGYGDWPEDLYLLGPIPGTIRPLRQSQRTDGQGQTERHSRMVQTEGGPSSTRAFGAGNNAYR